MPRLEDDVKSWARDYLKSLGFQGLTGEGSKLPRMIQEKFTSKTGPGKGYVDVAGDFRKDQDKGFIFITETKAPGLFMDAVEDLRHYMNDLPTMDLIGWATDSIQGLWIIRSEDGKEETIDERYDQRP